MHTYQPAKLPFQLILGPRCVSKQFHLTFQKTKVPIVPLGVLLWTKSHIRVSPHTPSIPQHMPVSPRCVEVWWNATNLATCNKKAWLPASAPPRPTPSPLIGPIIPPVRLHTKNENPINITINWAAKKRRSYNKLKRNLQWAFISIYLIKTRLISSHLSSFKAT